MTGQRKRFIDTDDFYSFTIGVSLNSITLNPMEFMASHASSTLGLQTLSLQGVAKTEVVFASFDVIGNINKYCVSPTTNSIILGVDPAVITTQALAINYIQGLLLIYDMIDLEYASTQPLYTLETRLSDGTFIGSSLQSSFDVLETKINALDENQNINIGGYYIHNLVRSIQAV